MVGAGERIVEPPAARARWATVAAHAAGRPRPELVAARQALTSETVRLLTFTGTAGVGKTRLAHEVGQQLATTFADGLCWVDLAPLADAHLVLPTIARRLGLAENGPVPVLDQVQHSLESRHLLLILDNFEHLLSAAPEISHLLARCPALRVLVTSREPLHLDWEHEFPVPPLSLPSDTRHAVESPAVVLFVQRARAVQQLGLGEELGPLWLEASIVQESLVRILYNCHKELYHRCLVDDTDPNVDALPGVTRQLGF